MDAATIEETNRIRVSLGMKPLPVPGATEANVTNDADSDSGEEPASTVETRQAQSYDNYRKVMESQAAQKKREERAAAIKKARETAQLHAKLEGKGLGEADDNEPTDAKAWLIGQKKRQKKIDKARKLDEERAAAEAEAAAAIQYTSKDLAGIKVAHDTSAFLDGDEQILTLKDAGIGEDEEGDELENLNLREQEALTDRLSLKKKTGYNPNDDGEEGGGILAQYDDEIDGKKRKKFTLDATGMNADLADILNQPVENASRSQNVSLDDLVGDAPISSDYIAASEIKVKKPKKKKNKGTRQKQLDDDDIFPLEAPVAVDSAMDVDSKGNVPVKKRKAAADDFGDDEDLQASLAIQRKNALKKRKKTRPEDIARQLKEQEEDEALQDSTENGGLVIGQVSEFVSGISKPEDDEEQKRKRRRATTKSPGLEQAEDHAMEDAEDPEHDTAQAEGDHSNPPDNANNGVDEEKVIGNGLGDTVALLRERGFWSKAEGSDVHESQRKREEFLAKKRLLEAELDEETRNQRERDRASGKLAKMSTREREDWARSQNTWRDQQQSKKMAELFSATYKPSVSLKYTDEHGRDLDQKEAFKHLSHQFHGKGSGKGKTEKMLKKIGDEKRREAQSMFDASSNGGMSVAAQQQLKKRREAGVRLG